MATAILHNIARDVNLNEPELPIVNEELFQFHLENGNIHNAAGHQNNISHTK